MNRDAEIAAVIAQLEGLLGALHANVGDLNAILAEPEVPGEQPAPA